ncbi:hypothetical protein B8W95_13130, partial [Staphylococcus pasteuri]
MKLVLWILKATRAVMKRECLDLYSMGEKRCVLCVASLLPLGGMVQRPPPPLLLVDKIWGLSLSIAACRPLCVQRGRSV